MINIILFTIVGMLFGFLIAYAIYKDDKPKDTININIEDKLKDINEKLKK